MSDAAQIAALQVRVGHLEDKIEEMATDVRAIRESLAEIRGGKKVLWSLWSILGAVIAAAGTYFTMRGH